jgi:hypothetical protein
LKPVSGRAQRDNRAIEKINNKIQDIAIKNDLDFKNRKLKTPIFNSIDIHQKNR